MMAAICHMVLCVGPPQAQSFGEERPRAPDGMEGGRRPRSGRQAANCALPRVTGEYGGSWA